MKALAEQTIAHYRVMEPIGAGGMGEVLVAAALGQQYGFADIDGKQPRPLALADV